jgi:hypothetical protein
MRFRCISAWQAWVACGFWLFLGAVAGSARPDDYFKIQVLDEQTGRGVPLVELRTVNKASWWTDSNGIVAFNEPGLMDLEVYFNVTSPGYEVPADFFRNRGVKLKPVRGGHAEIRIKRLNIAERLYRITGQGIYRDTLLLGLPAPLRQPVLNGQVMGQDTVIATPYRGKIYWFWGDTDRASYPLGNFGASGAYSELPGSGGLDPGVGVDLTYFVDPSGFSKPMCPLAEEGMKWIQALFTVRDERGAERLAARVGVMPGLEKANSWHLMLFNDRKQVFESFQRWDIHNPHNTGQPFLVQAEGTNFFYIFPDWRVPADLKSLADLSRYEAFTCLKQAEASSAMEPLIDRDLEGRVRYGWKAGVERMDSDRLRKLTETGKLKPNEMWFYAIDYESGDPLTRGLGSVAWNAFRHRWITFFAKENGDAWFAEADTPVGPWGYARQVLNHPDYNFYNLAHHPFFDQDGGQLVYFEGTYTGSFSKAGDNGTLTPRYDYNQLMYRVALDEPRLALPVAVYRVRDTNRGVSFMLREDVDAAAAWERVETVAWFALPPPSRPEGLVPVYSKGGAEPVLSTTRLAAARVLFAGLPLEQVEHETTVDGVWSCRAVTSNSGDSIDFSLPLAQRGTVVRVGNSRDAITGLGVFDGNKLTLTLTNEQKTFTLEAQVAGRKLEGQWREQGASAKGTWSASLPDSTPPERRSPALVTLREYRRPGASGYEYSIDAAPPPGCSADGRPICRVWKVPGSVLTLDWKAKPATRM